MSEELISVECRTCGKDIETSADDPFFYCLECD
jgi:endogenous inhibitor of DNA gyrase (YacG/DUF329 family)